MTTHLNKPNHGKRYLEEDFIGYNLEKAVSKLQEYWSEGRYVSCEFNGVWLYSDTVILDEAYVAITGKTKAEFDDYLLQEEEKRKKELAEHQASIPFLFEKYSDEGRAILEEEHWDSWDKILLPRLNDLYRGAELPASLEIIKYLKNNKSFEDTKELVISQKHSGLSESLVLHIVSEFSSRGADFKSYFYA